MVGFLWKARMLSAFDLTMPEQIIGCAALLLAAQVLRLSPIIRCAFFVIVFGCGLLAVTGGLASSFADAAVTRLFG